MGSQPTFIGKDADATSIGGGWESDVSPLRSLGDLRCLSYKCDARRALSHQSLGNACRRGVVRPLAVPTHAFQRRFRRKTNPPTKPMLISVSVPGSGTN